MRWIDGLLLRLELRWTEGVLFLLLFLETAELLLFCALLLCTEGVLVRLLLRCTDGVALRVLLRCTEGVLLLLAFRCTVDRLFVARSVRSTAVLPWREVPRCKAALRAWLLLRCVEVRAAAPLVSVRWDELRTAASLLLVYCFARTVSDRVFRVAPVLA